MLEPVDRRTYERIRELTRHVRVGERELAVCPCRVLPETVLQLKELLREVERLWREDLGPETYDRLRARPEGMRLLAGRTWLVSVQQGRPEMVCVWLNVPADYPRRIKVQLVDALEPHAPPDGP